MLYFISQPRLGHPFLGILHTLLHWTKSRSATASPPTCISGTRFMWWNMGLGVRWRHQLWFFYPTWGILTPTMIQKIFLIGSIVATCCSSYGVDLKRRVHRSRTLPKPISMWQDLHFHILGGKDQIRHWYLCSCNSISLLCACQRSGMLITEKFWASFCKWLMVSSILPPYSTAMTFGCLPSAQNSCTWRVWCHWGHTTMLRDIV